MIFSNVFRFNLLPFNDMELFILHGNRTGAENGSGTNGCYYIVQECPHWSDREMNQGSLFRIVLVQFPVPDPVQCE